MNLKHTHRLISYRALYKPILFCKNHKVNAEEGHSPCMFWVQTKHKSTFWAEYTIFAP